MDVARAKFPKSIIWTKTLSQTANWQNTDTLSSGGNSTAWQCPTVTGLVPFQDLTETVAHVWNIDADGVANTAGVVDSVCAVNKDIGISVVNYTGTGVRNTIGHGLGLVPQVLIVKALNQTYAPTMWHYKMPGHLELTIMPISTCG